MASPEFFNANSSQKEINIHNLHAVQEWVHESYILVGFYGGAAWVGLVIIKKHNLIVAPYFIPSWYLASYFLPVTLYYLYLHYFFSGGIYGNNFLNLTWREQEPAEFLLSMGFFIFVIVNRYRQRMAYQMPVSQAASQD